MGKWRFRILRWAVRWHRAQRDRRVRIYLPMFNLGCAGIGIGSWYADIFRNPGRWGIFMNTPIFRGWIFPGSLRIRRMG